MLAKLPLLLLLPSSLYKCTDSHDSTRHTNAEMVESKRNQRNKSADKDDRRSGFRYDSCPLFLALLFQQSLETSV